jgi:sortase B
MGEKDLEKRENNSEIDRNGNKEKKQKSKASVIIDKIISIIILIVCIIGLLYSGKKLYHWLLNNIKSNKVMTEINDIAGVSDITKDENPGAEFGLNFESLLAYNSDIVGWIRIPGTSISYSLVQADDNNKYLRHSIDLTWNEFGWPFLDYSNSPDFTDRNTVIYGHNIVSGLMFADLSYIYNGVLGNDVEIDIYRSDYRLLTYKVFSTYVYDPESYYLTTRFSDDEAYSTYLSTMLSRSVINFNQNVGVDDTIITLSTCTSDAKRRIVVHAKLISNTEMPR